MASFSMLSLPALVVITSVLEGIKIDDSRQTLYSWWEEAYEEYNKRIVSLLEEEMIQLCIRWELPSYHGRALLINYTEHHIRPLDLLLSWVGDVGFLMEAQALFNMYNAAEIL